MFNAIQGPHSGFFLHDDLVYEEINRASGQKAWHIDEPCQVPAFANALLRDIIINHLLGDENIWAAPANLRMDEELEAFQQAHSIVVPMLLQQKGAQHASLPFSRHKRAIRSEETV